MNVGMTGTPGLDLGKIFEGGAEAIGKRGEALQKRMTDMQQKKNLSPEDMVMVQFEMGQYNVLMESVSSVTKSLTDTMKSLTQRTS